MSLPTRQDGVENRDEVYYMGLSIIFSKILDAIWRITKVRNFLIFLSIGFLSSKILGFLFSTKHGLFWEVKCEKQTSENRRDFQK